VDAKSSSPGAGALQYEAHQLNRQLSWPFEEQRRSLQQGIRQAHAAARNSGTMFSAGRREAPGASRSPEPINSVFPAGENPSHYLPQ
jgi:hypothetical protein